MGKVYWAQCGHVHLQPSLEQMSRDEAVGSLSPAVQQSGEVSMSDHATTQDRKPRTEVGNEEAVWHALED